MKQFLLLLLIAAAPPANVTMKNGQPRAVVPVTNVDANGNTMVGGTQATPLGYQQLTDTQLATVQTLTVPTGATHAYIQNNGTQAVRYLDTGGSPTTSTGARIPGGATLDYRGDLTTLKFIREASGVSLDVLYYGG